MSNRINSRCPSCGCSTLVWNETHIICTLLGCRDPTLAQRMLEGKHDSSEVLHVLQPESSKSCESDVMGMHPTVVPVDEEILRSAHDLLEISLEHVRGSLVEHDAHYGRTILKNKTWALRLESDIRRMEFTLQSLKKVLGFTSPQTATDGHDLSPPITVDLQCAGDNDQPSNHRHAP